ncbi:MAG: hypothetical protein P1P64_01275 [Treponemataceae bacterium]
MKTEWAATIITTLIGIFGFAIDVLVLVVLPKYGVNIKIAGWWSLFLGIRAVYCYIFNKRYSSMDYDSKFRTLLRAIMFLSAFISANYVIIFVKGCYK